MSEFTPTHKSATGELVRATHWKKDGDHPQVERYPIERREFKGLLTVSEKEKYALHFGDWIVEDSQGRVAVYGGAPRKVMADEPVEGHDGVFRRVAREQPSQFDELFTKLEVE